MHLHTHAECVQIDATASRDQAKHCTAKQRIGSLTFHVCMFRVCVFIRLMLSTECIERSFVLCCTNWVCLCLCVCFSRFVSPFVCSLLVLLVLRRRRLLLLMFTSVCLFILRSFYLIGTANVWSFSFPLSARAAFISRSLSFPFYISLTSFYFSFCFIFLSLRSQTFGCINPFIFNMYIVFLCHFRRRQRPSQLFFSRCSLGDHCHASRKSGIHCLCCI